MTTSTRGKASQGTKRLPKSYEKMIFGKRWLKKIARQNNRKDHIHCQTPTPTGASSSKRRTRALLQPSGAAARKPDSNHSASDPLRGSTAPSSPTRLFRGFRHAADPGLVEARFVQSAQGLGRPWSICRGRMFGTIPTFTIMSESVTNCKQFATNCKCCHHAIDIALDAAYCKSKIVMEHDFVSIQCI